MASYAHLSFGVSFESMLSTGLGELLSRLDGISSEVFTAVDSTTGQIHGTVFMDGIDLSRAVDTTVESNEYSAAAGTYSTGSKVHLRGFVVDENVRGGGVGKRMLDAALTWADERFEEVHLWTFQGLDVARRLYEGRGFELRDEEMRRMWEGKELLVQHFVRVR